MFSYKINIYYLVNHQFFYTGVLLAAQNDHSDNQKKLVIHANGIGEIFFAKPFSTTPVTVVQQRYKVPL